MPNLKELRNRILSVKSTQKITRAMQMVAASKLRKAQDAVENSRPYSSNMATICEDLTKSLSSDKVVPLLTGSNAQQRHLVVVCTADRGLCGGFNSSIVRLAKKYIFELSEQGKEVSLICVGKKGYDQLVGAYGSLIYKKFETSSSGTVGYDDAKAIGNEVTSLLLNDQFDVCCMFFSRFKSVVSQIVTRTSLIPFISFKDEEDGEKVDKSGAQTYYEFEPGQEEILEALPGKNLNVQLLSAMLENAAGEQGARVSAMDSATRNAGEMLNGLSLTYNRTRQAMITKELIEIISGAESV